MDTVIIPKFAIGTAPVWLKGREIMNKDRSFKVCKIYIEKTKDYCNIYYDLIHPSLSQWNKMMESNLFQTIDEVKDSII